MRTLAALLLCLAAYSTASAQIPVTDAANIAQAVAILAEVHQQVQTLEIYSKVVDGQKKGVS